MDTSFYNSLVHWKTDDLLLPLWQLTGENVLRVDITSQFDAKFRLSALCGISDDKAIVLKELMEEKTIPCTPCGQNGFMGFCDTIFEHTNKVGEGWGWHVNNNAMESPGFTKYAVQGRVLHMQTGNDFRDHVAKHPEDGYTVQFENVPWTVFKRYWRKPIHLDRKIHSHGYISWHPAVQLLHVDLEMLRRYKCIFIDFNRSDMKDENPEMSKWMIKYAKAFRTMSDDPSPFVKEDAELLFTLEWM